jgi:antitoxin CptB
MRELDVLLTRWLDQCYPDADEIHKSAFQQLLSLSDPDLVRYLVAGEQPEDPTLASVVRQIRGTDPA